MTSISQRMAALGRLLASGYGFVQPYDFAKVLPVLVSACLAVLTLALRVGFSWLGVLPPDTPKAWFLDYLLIVALLALAASVRPVVAGGLLMLFLLEAGLASASWALVRLQMLPVASNLVPDNNPLVKRFRYHPLLQAVPTPHFAAGKSFIHITHNSHGFRGPERDPGQLASKRVVMAFGGSTTYDLTVRDGMTWTEQLERALGGDFAVLNFGVPGYTTVEHILQTTFYADRYGVPPVCALYYIGWNDIRNAYLPDLDPAYADFHLISQVDTLQIRPEPAAVRVSPLLKVVFRLSSQLVDTIPRAPTYHDSQRAADDLVLERIYQRNVSAISAINHSRAIKSLFVGQLLNRAKLTSAEKYGWLVLVPDKEAWPLQARFNELLEARATANGDTYLDAGIDRFAPEDFTDNGHFSEAGAAKFATSIAPAVRAQCAAPKSRPG